jgi:hypothetical protein
MKIMDSTTQAAWANLRAQDGNLRFEALNAMLAATDQRVDWAYEVWDELVETLRHPDNHQRAIAAQLLCNLAKSDPDQRILRDFDALFAVTKDAKFVTARHSLQAIWKVAAAGAQQQQLAVDRLAGRFRDCAVEKNCTLIRYDIIQSLRNLYEQVRDAQVRETALTLIATEDDSKYRKKYASLWRAG